MDIKMSMEALIKHFKFFSTGLVLPKKWTICICWSTKRWVWDLFSIWWYQLSV
jgi:hypothetical protein